MRAAEDHQLKRAAHRGVSAEPGSTEEARALQRIEVAREEEQAGLGDDFAKRRRRSRHYWGRRGDIHPY